MEDFIAGFDLDNLLNFIGNQAFSVDPSKTYDFAPETFERRKTEPHSSSVPTKKIGLHSHNRVVNRCSENPRNVLQMLDEFPRRRPIPSIKKSTAAECIDLIRKRHTEKHTKSTGRSGRTMLAEEKKERNSRLTLESTVLEYSGGTPPIKWMREMAVVELKIGDVHGALHVYEQLLVECRKASMGQTKTFAKLYIEYGCICNMGGFKMSANEQYKRARHLGLSKDECTLTVKHFLGYMNSLNGKKELWDG